MFNNIKKLKMKKVKFLLTFLAIVFTVSACELSPGEIEPIDNQFILENDQSGEDMDDNIPPPPPPSN